MMAYVDVLTWIFRSAFIAGACLSFSAAYIWHRRSRGAWRRSPAGAVTMVFVLSWGTMTGAVALRVLTVLLQPYAPWLDVVVLLVVAVAVWAAVAAVGRLLVLVLTAQPDYRAEQEDNPTNGSQDEDLRS